MVFRKLSEDAADFGLPMEPLPAPSHWQQNTTCRLAHSQAIMHHRDTTKAPAGQLDHSSTTATTGTPKPQGHQRTITVSKDTTPAAQHESTTRTPCTPQAPPKTKPFVRRNQHRDATWKLLGHWTFPGQKETSGTPQEHYHQNTTETPTKCQHTARDSETPRGDYMDITGKLPKIPLGRQRRELATPVWPRGPSKGAAKRPGQALQSRQSIH